MNLIARRLNSVLPVYRDCLYADRGVQGSEAVRFAEVLSDIFERVVDNRFTSSRVRNDRSCT
jgi:hypothetical protein